MRSVTDEAALWCAAGACDLRSLLSEESRFLIFFGVCIVFSFVGLGLFSVAVVCFSFFNEMTCNSLARLRKKNAQVVKPNSKFIQREDI